MTAEPSSAASTAASVSVLTSAMSREMSSVERRGRVADADQIAARVDLGLGEFEPQLKDELEQVLDELRIVEEVDH
jgi:hypothetical protein